MVVLPASTFDCDQVVSFNGMGEPLSRKGDDVWILEDRRNKLSDNVSFNMARIYPIKSKGYSENVTHAKDIFGCSLRFYHKGELLRIGTLRGHYKLLKDIGKYCSGADVALLSFFATPYHLIDYVKKAKPSLSQYLPGMLEKMHHERYLHLPYELIGTVRAIVNAFEKVQTLAVPPRILSIKVFRCEEVMNVFLLNCRRISQFAIRVRRDKMYARSIYTQSQLAGARNATSPVFAEAMEELGLEQISKTYNIADISQFTLFLTVVQYATKCLIQIFSAMRNSEAMELQYGCLGTRRIEGLVVDTITGAPSKVADLTRPGVWVTSRLGVKAVKVARIISRIVYRGAGYKTDARSYLFISPTYAGFSSCKSKDFPKLSTRLNSNDVADELGSITFTQADFDDLKNLLPLGEIDNHPNLIVGEPWSFTSHQYRRSFGIYATASGLANYPALKSQFNHFKVATSMSYGESGLAKVDFGGDGSHIQLAYEDETLSMDAGIYVKDVLFSKEPLYGPKGNYMRSVVEMNPIDNVAVAYQETLKSMKKGRLAYTATVLGGCTTSQPCQKKAHGSLVVCTNCPDGIIKVSKLVPVIAEQKSLVQSLSQETVEYRTELAQLNELEKFLARIKGGDR